MLCAPSRYGMCRPIERGKTTELAAVPRGTRQQQEGPVSEKLAPYSPIRANAARLPKLLIA